MGCKWNEVCSAKCKHENDVDLAVKEVCMLGLEPYDIANDPEHRRDENESDLNESYCVDNCVCFCFDCEDKEAQDEF